MRNHKPEGQANESRQCAPQGSSLCVCAPEPLQGATLPCGLRLGCCPELSTSSLPRTRPHGFFCTVTPAHASFLVAADNSRQPVQHRHTHLLPLLVAPTCRALIIFDTSEASGCSVQRYHCSSVLDTYEHSCVSLQHRVHVCVGGVCSSMHTCR